MFSKAFCVLLCLFNTIQIAYEILFNKTNDTKKNDTWICANFNEEGGHYKDRLIFIEYIKKEKEKDCLYKCQFIKVPFFDKEEKGIDIKSK